MTTRPKLLAGHLSDSRGEARDPRLSGGGLEADGVPNTHRGEGGPHQGRLVHRPAAELRPHPIYLEVCGPVAATRATRLAQQAWAMCEPLLITTDGTILDGHVRWQVAMDRHQPSLCCIEYDLTEEEALEFLLARHHKSVGLNAFCRIVAALKLEPYYRASNSRRPQAASVNTRSSNLTNVGRKDVRAEIARIAGVSTGNVTKVKQLLGTVSPEVRESLRRGDVSIHQAWLWRHLSVKQQRDALWAHRNRKETGQTIRGLIMQHIRSQRVVPSVDQVRGRTQRTCDRRDCRRGRRYPRERHRGHPGSATKTCFGGKANDPHGGLGGPTA